MNADEDLSALVDLACHWTCDSFVLPLYRSPDQKVPENVNLVDWMTGWIPGNSSARSIDQVCAVKFLGTLLKSYHTFRVTAFPFIT